MDSYTSEFDYDLMTMTGRTLTEYRDMGAAGRVALAHFACNLPIDSATLSKESGYDAMAIWTAREKTNMILADIYDELGAFIHVFASSKSKRRPKKQDPYPRPWAKKKKKHFGSKPIKAGRFADWWKSKAKR